MRLMLALMWLLHWLPLPVLGRISQDRLLLDFRCLDSASTLLDQLPALRRALWLGG